MFSVSELFSEAVTKRMDSDVEVANFLSGGIDSTAIIKSLNDQNYLINSYSVGYKNDKYDESYWFNQVVKKYDLNHHTQYLSKNDISEDIEAAISSFDEPYADPSIVPSYTLSRLISEKYKVAISGDGGDELLGGYIRLQNLFLRKKYLNSFKYLNKIYPNSLGTGNKFIKNSKNFNEAYSSYFEDLNFTRLLGIDNNQNPLNGLMSNVEDEYKKALITDYNFYLSEMMMLKVDRTSMANSLEVRSPFVDHKLVEYIVGSSYEYFDKDKPKKLLKNQLSSDFDNAFLNRKKMGFVFNLENWIYSNINEIKDVINSDTLSSNLNLEVIDKLSINKSRINAQRIWKLYIIEKYISRL